MTWVRLGSGCMFLAVALGAFAAHALKTKLQPDLFAIFEVGVRYHVYHALALFAVAWLASLEKKYAGTAGILFTVGIVIFSGSLYLLALTGQRWLGAITPIGGLAFLAGWAFLVASTY